MKHKCADCENVYEGSNPPVPLEEIEDLRDRLSPGSEVPSGECSCGALTYLVAKEETEEKLVHRELLLSGLFEVLRDRESENEKRLSSKGLLTMDLNHLDVVFYDAEGEVALETSWISAFDQVVNGLWWDENGDWRNACKVVLV